MTGMDGPEVESLRVAHERAQVAVQGVPVESTSEGVRGFLDESAVPFGGIGFKASDHHGEHRSVREAVVGIADQDAGPSSNRRVGGTAIARIGVPIAGPSRVIAGSQCGHPQPESEASLPSRISFHSATKNSKNGWRAGARTCKPLWKRVRRLHLISSQSVAPASSSPQRDCNRFAAVPPDGAHQHAKAAGFP